MAKYCDKDCKAICDFCKFYKDNMEDGKFTGVGRCTKKNRKVSASMSCDNDFECFRT